jgi:putative transposase
MLQAALLFRVDTKKRRKMIFGSIRKHLGAVFHDLARQKGVIIE